MPKIIENLREKLLEEAKKQIKENGYAKTTIRSIAKGCDVGTGTVYNYFPSKDMLIASFMSGDWKKCVENMKASETDDPKAMLRLVCESLESFIENHDYLLSDKDAGTSFSSAYSTYHGHMRKQVAQIIMPMCEKNGRPDPFVSEFIAESILIWTVNGKSFEEQYEVLKLLFD
ncbi:MAG: TetR/AcrR family transcriptional regulator [Firmicutes bacterium]|nr:TetR/AcrR family transcriptional regulator [Bacillota bacterium]